MNKYTRYGTFVFILAFWPCIPGTTTLSQVIASRSDDSSPRLLDYDFRQVHMASVIQKIAEPPCLKIVFDDSVAESVKSTQISLRLMKSSPMRALAIVLESQQLNYEYTGDRTLVIFKGKAPEKVKLVDMVYQNTSFITSIEQICQFAGLKIRLHNSAQVFRGASLTIDLKAVSALHALESILSSRRLTYEYVDCGTIIIFRDESVRLT